MPLYDTITPKIDKIPGCMRPPKLSKDQEKEIATLDALEIDPGKIYANGKGEEVQVLRIIYCAGALCRISEIVQRGKSGEPVIWRTVDADGPRCDILTIGPSGEHKHYTPDEFSKWAGGKPKFVRPAKKVPLVGTKQYEHLVEAARRAKVAQDKTATVEPTIEDKATK